MSRKTGHHLGLTEFANVPISQSLNKPPQSTSTRREQVAGTGRDWQGLDILLHCFWRPIADTNAAPGDLLSLPAGRRKTDWVTRCKAAARLIYSVWRTFNVRQKRAGAARKEEGEDAEYLKATRNGFQGSDALADSSQLTNSLRMLAVPIQGAFIGWDVQQANVRFLRFCG